MPALVTIRFSEDCWLFLRAVEPSPSPTPLSAEVRAAIDRTPRIEVARPRHEARYVVSMPRPHAYDLLRWLQTLHDSLGKQDARRGICRQCFEEVALTLSGG